MLVVCILSLCVNLTFAQNVPQKNIPAPKHKKNDKNNNQKLIPQNIINLLNQARSLPPEFYTDVLIRVAESKKINDTDTNIDLLKEAFEQAAQVQLKKKKTIFKSINIDTRIGYLDTAYNLNLDMLSLKCRIINNLVELDKNSAKEYFFGISLASYVKETLSCKDIAIYNITVYYETARKIAERCFTNKEIEEGVRTRFIEEHITSMVSATQLNQVANLITTFNWSSPDLDILLAAYINKVAHLDIDYRSFIASESLYKTTESIHNLASYCEKRQLSSKYLTQAYREYIIKNLSQKVCPGSSEKEKLIPQLILRANGRLFRENPIVLKELKLEEDFLAEDPPFFSSTKSKSILDGLRRLNADIQKKASGDSSYKETDLEENYSKFYANFRNWKASDEPTEEDYLNQKATTYKELIEIAQTEKQRDELLLEYILFLRDFKLENISRPEWFIHLNFVLKMIKSSNQETDMKVVKLLRNSRIGVAELYTTIILEGL